MRLVVRADLCDPSKREDGLNEQRPNEEGDGHGSQKPWRRWHGVEGSLPPGRGYQHRARRDQQRVAIEHDRGGRQQLETSEGDEDHGQAEPAVAPRQRQHARRQSEEHGPSKGQQDLASIRRELRHAGSRARLHQNHPSELLHHQYRLRPRPRNQ